MKLLRPGYPCPLRYSLSSRILNEVSKETVCKIKGTVGPYSVLIIDGWKNPSSNDQTITCILHNADGTRAFLESFNYTETQLAESGINLNDTVNLCRKVALEKFNTTIYCVISDNARNMMSMGNLTNLWHSTCSSHTANLLLKDINDKDICKTVVTILKQFRNTAPAHAILLHGGTKLQLPVETRWCTYRDVYNCFLRNLQSMKHVIAEGKCTKWITSETVRNIYDEELKLAIELQIELQNPICELIQNCQSLDYSISDACECWLNLRVPDKFQHFLEQRKTIALNIYAKTANFLDPKYREQKLSEEDLDEAEVFLINLMNEDGLASLQDFKEKIGIFHVMEQKSISNSILFWKCVQSKHKALAELAYKLISIPASSAEVERTFSNWKFVHSTLRNRLNFDKSKKLVEVYYDLNKLKTSEQLEFMTISDDDSEVDL